eukprot:TRINITY_DN2413_c0_g1_i10.p1 TRINITY_DN2413_c0_g1~~TRINITY_DN2413_c0_g1_i10.p1  ORF type:complete len:318 (+),score=56.22 TRINITY_DN2413_c0_g1_i10:789-1742(+)
MGLESLVRDPEQNVLADNYFQGRFSRIKYFTQLNSKIRFKCGLSQQLLLKPTFGVDNSAACTFLYKNDNIDVSQKFTTEGNIRFRLNYDVNRWVKNVVVGAEGETNWSAEVNNTKLSLSHNGENHEFKASLVSNDSRTFNSRFIYTIRPGASSTQKVGDATPTSGESLSRYVVGAGLSYNIDKKSFSLYKAILSYQRDAFWLSLVHANEKNGFDLQRVTVSLWNRLNDRTDIALELDHNYVFNQSKLVAGLRRRVSDALTFKAKLDDQFRADTALLWRISPQLRLTLASKHDLKPSQKPADTIVPVGFSLSIGDESD